MTQQDQPNHQIGPVRRTVDVSLMTGIVLAIASTVIYLFSPVDLVPDLLPVLGQIDDLTVVLLGGGSVSLLTLMRVFIGTALRNRAARRGCMMLLLAASLPTLCGLVCLVGAGIGLLASR